MAAPSPADAAAPGGIKKHLPFIVALLLGLVVGGGAGAFVVGPAMAKGIAPAGAAAPRAKAHAGDEEASADEESHDESDGEASGGEHGGDGKAAAEKAVYTIDNLVLNPAESGGTRFLLLTVSFEVKNAAILDQMKTRDAELRDAVLVTLGKKTVDQLADMAQREALKADLTKAAATLFKKGAVKQIYFPQFVIQ